MAEPETLFGPRNWSLGSLSITETISTPSQTEETLIASQELQGQGSFQGYAADAVSTAQGRTAHAEIHQSSSSSRVAFYDIVERNDGGRGSLNQPFPSKTSPSYQNTGPWTAQTSRVRSRHTEAAMRPTLARTQTSPLTGLPLGPRSSTRKMSGGSRRQWSGIPNGALDPTLPITAMDKPAVLSTRQGFFLTETATATSPIDIQVPEGSSERFSRNLVIDGQSPRTSRSNSFRRNSRACSSTSPAMSYLSRYIQEPEREAEPDDEGQKIPESGGYVIGRKIGSGGFSVVKEAILMADAKQTRRAVKIVRKHKSNRSQREDEKVQNEFEREVRIWRPLKFPYILPVHQVLTLDTFGTFCLTDLCAGTLHDLVAHYGRTAALDSVSGSSGGANPSEAKKDWIALGHMRRFIAQLASALHYLHEDVGIVHRDIKLENCLLKILPNELEHMSSVLDASLSIDSVIENLENAKILLCDFGMADYIDEDAREEANRIFGNSLMIDSDEDSESDMNFINTRSRSSSVPGTPQYLAPELLEAEESIYDPCVDNWAFGVACYRLLTGSYPFKDVNWRLRELISKGDWNKEILYSSVKNLAEDIPSHVRGTNSGSEDANDAVTMIRGCLDLEPLTRWNMAKVLSCGFLAHGDSLHVHDGEG